MQVIEGFNLPIQLGQFSAWPIKIARVLVAKALVYYHIYKQGFSYGSSPSGRLNAVIFLPELLRYSTPNTYVALIRG